MYKLIDTCKRKKYTCYKCVLDFETMYDDFATLPNLSEVILIQFLVIWLFYQYIFERVVSLLRKGGSWRSAPEQILRQYPNSLARM